MSEIKIYMKLFGAFKKYGDEVDFTLPSGCTVLDVKNKLAETLEMDDAALITDSAIANDNEIISGDDVMFTEDSHLAILPPVCGG